MHSDRSSIRKASSGGARFAGAPVTKWMMVAMALIFLVDVSGSAQVGRLRPYLEMSSGRFSEIWRWGGHAFVSIDVIGWIFSLFILYGFGRMVERFIGSRRFAVFIIFSIIGSALVYCLISLGVEAHASLTGTSSLTLGLVTLAAMMQPELQVQLLVPPVLVKMRTLAIFFIGFIVITSIMQQLEPAVSLAQLSGVVIAYLCVKKISVLDLGKRKPRVQAIKRPAKKRNRRGMKARTILNMNISKREAEVNRILDKVSAEGIGNLTETEKEILKFAAQDE